MTQPNDWDTLRDAWRPAPAHRSPREDDASGLITRANRARRTMALVRAAEVLVVTVAVGGVAAALRHAANIVELILGLSVMLAIAGAGAFRVMARRRERDIAGTSALEYVTVLRALRQRQIHFVHFGWLVLALELVFFLTWWAGGVSVHRTQLGAPIAIASLWVPLATIVAFVAWTARLRTRASADLVVLARLERELRDE